MTRRLPPSPCLAAALFVVACGSDGNSGGTDVSAVSQQSSSGTLSSSSGAPLCGSTSGGNAVWPLTQYVYALNSGIEDAYRSIIPSTLLSLEDHVFPASCEAPVGTTLDIRSSGDPSHAVWFAPEHSTSFVEGDDMTRAAGDATTIAVPGATGTYKLFVLDAEGQKLGESAALLRVVGE